MAATNRAPKQWCLGKHESVTSLESWWQNLLYTLSQDGVFAPYLEPGLSWLPRGRTTMTRGFTDDDSSVPRARRQTAQQKVATLEMMLGQIANFCPIISRNSIVKNSKSVKQIYQMIRLHFGFQSSGSHFLDFAELKLEPEEKPEDLYQRIAAFVEDSLLQTDSNITHHDLHISEDEELTPTLENMVVLTWLRLVHPQLPKLVKQRYGTELRCRTLASIKPEISQALPSLLDELQTAENSRIMRSDTQRNGKFQASSLQPHRSNKAKSCPLCKQAGRPDRHYLSKCTYLPEVDRKFITKARQICDVLDQSQDESDHDEEEEEFTASRVEIRASPFLDTFYDHHSIRIVLDTGATGNLIRASTARYLGIPVTKATQSARQADGRSPLSVLGEVRMQLTHGNRQLHFEGLVVENLDVEILAGMPFMHHNQLGVFPARHEVLFGDGKTHCYQPNMSKRAIHTRRAIVLRAPAHSTTIWPGDFIEINLPSDCADITTYAVEARPDTAKVQRCSSDMMWPSPNIVTSVAGKIRIPNLTDEPQTLQRNEHFCQIIPTFTPDTEEATEHVRISLSASSQKSSNNCNKIQLDPGNQLDTNMKQKFIWLHNEYCQVFESTIPGYNGAMGPCYATVNMGPVQPPQRKGRVPQYSRDKLNELQSQFDDLEAMGVFKRPADIGVCAEYLNPSFLVKKPNGGHRLVTAFAEVGRYAKPQPSLMPDVDSTLRQIGQWKYIIVTDLSKAFYQIPLAKDSLKYCGVATPFKGVRVYVRSAMGMPGSETALEELMCKVFGELLQEGAIAKLADDLFCGGQTLEELYNNWQRVLHILSSCDLRLSAAKTVVAPKSTTILGWCWEQGTLRANLHRISTLAACKPPEKVKDMRSFIGAYKVLSRVLPGCASYLSDLERSTIGLSSCDPIPWTEELHETFTQAQRALSTHRTILLPRANEQLWIITDGSVKKQGIGATMYAQRGEKLRLAGFFSAKLRDRQVTWLPCEIEALAISSATKHFSPFIIQSQHRTCILTDSKPCVQAYEKLCRGAFSASPRVTTFLSTISRFQASVQHIAGISNLPSDYASRNAAPCTSQSCQICSFIAQTEDSVVQRASADDIIKGITRLPFTSRATWAAIQNECKDLRRTRAHLLQGTRPSKKLTNVKDIKRYLNVTSIAQDGLLVVTRNDPLCPTRECIVVPRHAIDGLLTALHINLDHPSAYQLKRAFQRYLYALDVDARIANVTQSCHTCTSLRKHKLTAIEQSTGDPPENIGLKFAADVIKRNRQLIFVVREYISSLTLTCLLANERKEDLKDALIRLLIEMCPLDGPNAVVRTDGAPGFKSLENDEMLLRHRITIEVGRLKNPNKNPVADKAIQELEEEILRHDPTGGLLTSRSLAIATARLNSRIRSRGLSAREMWCQRDQFTNAQIPLIDEELIKEQYHQKLKNHPHSERSKAPGRPRATEPIINEGDIVYLINDRNKLKARDRYLVTSVNGEWCNVKKFTTSQLLKTSYRVKTSECYKALKIPLSENQPIDDDDHDDDDDDEDQDGTTSSMEDNYHDNSSDHNDKTTHQPSKSKHHNQLQETIDVPTIPPEIADTPTKIKELPSTSQQDHKHSRPTRNRKPPSWLKDYVL